MFLTSFVLQWLISSSRYLPEPIIIQRILAFFKSIAAFSTLSKFWTSPILPVKTIFKTPSLGLNSVITSSADCSWKLYSDQEGK